MKKLPQTETADLQK